MIANYHTHTVRCRHAVGTEEDYIARAVEGGLQILGFSDHTPYWFDTDFYSTFRMFPQQLTDYVDTVQGLKRQYQGKLDIFLGLEAEYYPRLFPELLRRLRDYPVDYLLLGQHYVGNEVGQQYLGATPVGDAAVLEQYCDQTVDALYTGLFSCFAHPDILSFYGDDTVYRQHMRRVCRAARECAVPLEINLLGLRQGRHYPNVRFWELAAEEGCTAVLGCDAHRPEHVYDPEQEKKALELAKICGIQVAQKISLQPIL